MSTEKRAASGVYYALPRGTVTLTMSADADGQFQFQISDTAFGPDPEHRYFLRYQPHSSYHDDITITLAAGRPFLKKIESTTIDKTKDIVVDLAKATAFAGGFQSFSTETARLLAQAPIDPSDPKAVDDIRQEIDEAMHRFLRGRNRECRRSPPTTDNGKASCTYIAALLTKSDAYRRGKGGEALFTLVVTHPPQPPRGRPADCSVGVCYRAKIPYLIVYSVAGVTDTKIVELPNGSEIVSIDLSRAFLVKKVQTLEFDDDGFLTSLKITKDSELLAAAKLPLEVLSAVASGLQLRIDYTQKNTEIAKSEAALIKRRAKLKQDTQAAEERRKAVADAKPSAVVAIPKVFDGQGGQQ